MARNTKRRDRNSASSNFYSDDMTKEVVGRLFEQYTAEDGQNYFAPTSRRNTRDAEEQAQKEEDRKSFFEEEETEEEGEETKKESRFSRFVRKAKMVVLPPDDDDDEDDDENQEESDGFENLFNEDGEAEPLHVPSPDSIPEIDEQQTYVPRRKERPKKAKPEAVEEEPQEPEEDIFAELEQQKEEPEAEQPKKSSLRERMEKRVDAKRKREKPASKPKTEETSPVEDDFFEEDDDEDGEVFELPFARGVLIAIVAVVVLLLLILIFRCISYSSQLKEANAQIEQLQNMNTSSTYEKEIEELRSKNEELTKQLDDIRAASAVVSATDGTTSEAPETPNGSNPTVGADGQGDTSNLSQQASSDQSYTVISYSGGTPWELAEEAYGEGSRYDEILKFNNMTAEDFENITYGTELKIPN